jgi:hypothetical protein
MIDLTKIKINRKQYKNQNYKDSQKKNQLGLISEINNKIVIMMIIIKMKNTINKTKNNKTKIF